jgi:hypothetical protein
VIAVSPVGAVTVMVRVGGVTVSMWRGVALGIVDLCGTVVEVTWVVVGGEVVHVVAPFGLCSGVQRSCAHHLSSRCHLPVAPMDHPYVARVRRP